VSHPVTLAGKEDIGHEKNIQSLSLLVRHYDFDCTPITGIR
jgi:hypothetical protein